MCVTKNYTYDYRQLNDTILKKIGALNSLPFSFCYSVSLTFRDHLQVAWFSVHLFCVCQEYFCLNRIKNLRDWFFNQPFYWNHLSLSEILNAPFKLEESHSFTFFFLFCIKTIRFVAKSILLANNSLRLQKLPVVSVRIMLVTIITHITPVWK